MLRLAMLAVLAAPGYSACSSAAAVQVAGGSKCLDFGGAGWTGTCGQSAARCAQLGGAAAVLANANEWDAAVTLLSALPPAERSAWTGLQSNTLYSSSLWCNGEGNNGGGSIIYITFITGFCLYDEYGSDPLQLRPLCEFPLATPTPSASATQSSSASMSPSRTSSGTSSGTASPTPAVRCQAGSFSFSGFAPCTPCAPGTYSSETGSQNCLLCPAGTFGDHAGLETASCSGGCASCTAGSTAPLSQTCSSNSGNALPATIGLLLWPAAHPSNPQQVDLVVAPAALCAQLSPGGVCTTAVENQIVGSDGVTRFVVGTAAQLKMEAATVLTCAAS